ncbi:MAG TPA: amidohydrolase family protein [Methylomirabilota bacterium]|nr:amidohydrolase family protein [Methylomirabilota bacterium]
MEEILEPGLPICDPHHHLWDHPRHRYLLDELLADTGSGHDVRATVFVECLSMYRAHGPDALRPVGETEFVNGIAAMSASRRYDGTRVAAGIVSFADLTLGEAAGAVLDAHRAASPRFRGIRHAAGWDASEAIRNSHTNPPPGLLADGRFRRGFAELVRRGLTFDAWCYHPQLPEVAALARAFPDATIVLDHFGGPLGIGPYRDRRAEVFAWWRGAIKTVAECPNVVAKLGGLVMPLNGFGFHKRAAPPDSAELAAATRDWYLHAIDCFGPARCMFESNFPVDKVSASYRVLWNSFKRITASFSKDDKAALFHDTAARVYRVHALE